MDQAFATGLNADPASDAIMALAVDLAHRLGLTVVAEGVETSAVFDAIRRHGCDVAQGYWICRPSNEDDITGWLVAAARDGLRWSQERVGDESPVMLRRTVGGGP